MGKKQLSAVSSIELNSYEVKCGCEQRLHTHEVSVDLYNM